MRVVGLRDVKLLVFRVGGTFGESWLVLGLLGFGVEGTFGEFARIQSPARDALKREARSQALPKRSKSVLTFIYFPTPKGWII